jgi:hypothetical protein
MQQRREVQYWLNLFEQQKQSGLTAVGFCRQQQINVQTYYTKHRDVHFPINEPVLNCIRPLIPPSA